MKQVNDISDLSGGVTGSFDSFAGFRNLVSFRHPQSTADVDSESFWKESRKETMKRERLNKMTRIAMSLALGLLACNLAVAQDVTTNSMPGTDFSKYHTYKWVPVAGATPPNQIVDQQIKDAVNSQLATKGMTVATGETADLLVGYQISIDQERQWNAMGTGMRGFGGGMGTATSSTIQIGTLVLDMYDPSTKQLVWQGRATKTIDPGNNQDKKQKNLNNAMKKLLQKYPPK
jgi:hypothetical protein